MNTGKQSMAVSDATISDLLTNEFRLVNIILFSLF